MTEDRPVPTIRPAVPADAPAVVTLRATVFPYLVRGVAATNRLIASPPPQEAWAAFVATEADEIVGWVAAYRNVRAAAPDAGQISTLHVHPDHRRQGIGDALFAAATDHLRSIGARHIGAIVDPGSLEFARRHGFEPTREIRYSALDLSRLPAVKPVIASPSPAGRDRNSPAGPGPSPGFYSSEKLEITGGACGQPGVLPVDAVVPLSEIGEQALYAADVAAATDEPGDLPPAPTPYPTWRYEVWDDDDLDRRASTAAVLDGRVVAFTLLHREGDRLWSDMTATVPEHRGRGLARLVKWTAIQRAAADGATVAYTANAESNRPMLAVNEWLGYRPVATQLSCVTTLAA